MGRPLKVGGSTWRYLTDSVTGEVGEVRLGAGPARYYAAKGTPPGRFVGSGLGALGSFPGSVKAGDQVSPEMLAQMLERLADPLTGKVLGQAPRGKKGRAVAGYDLTFSPPKSVSIAWAMADRGTKAVIEDVLHQAAAEVISWAERQVFSTRSGTDGVRHEAIRGVVANSWLHYESRDHDPQIHHHVVVLNRAQTASDGRWRSLDGKALYPFIVALSERHTGLVEDLLTERFGYAWEESPTLTGRDKKREVAGVPASLVDHFSRRKASLSEVLRAKVATFETAHGRDPGAEEHRRLTWAAWRETRVAKVHRSLAELTEEWTARAQPFVGDRPASWAQSLLGRAEQPALRSDDLTDDMVAEVAKAALQARSERSSVFTKANLGADVERALHGLRFASGERQLVAERALAHGLAMAVKLSPPELTHVPERFKSPDGSSQFSPSASWTYTTAALLEAEARLLAAGQDTSGPKLGFATVAEVCDAPLPGRTYGLGADQAVAVEQLATSGRSLDLLVGPAGTGKTTTLAGLRAAWEAEHGAGSVKGLATSATAAAELGEELGIATENTAKWLTEAAREQVRTAELGRLRARLSRHLSPGSLRSLLGRVATLEAELERWRLRAGDLVVVDEAGMAGTFALDRLVAQAQGAGAKVVLVGDWAQLAAVEAGGAFSMLVDDRELVPELSEVHRFKASWEREASVGLRTGSARAIDAYLAHDRVASGNRDEMLESLYRAWREDVGAGKEALMIAQDLETVAELNRRARGDRVRAGEVEGQGLSLVDGLVAGVGDQVVTRENDRRLRLPDGDWVRNRDRFVVTAVHEDGAMTVRQAKGEGQVVLPAAYVASHVELGYASSAYAAQGRNVDVAHAMVGVTLTGEVLYVAATRGAESNRLYVDVEPEPAGAEMAHGRPEPMETKEVLLAVAARRGADVSAHQTTAVEWERATSFEQLVNEHQSLVAAAVAERFEQVMERAGLAAEQLERGRHSPEWVGLLGALRDAETRGLAADAVVPRLVSEGPIESGKDPALVLRVRLHRFERASGARWSPRQDLVAGMVPRAMGIADMDLARAIREREEAIAGRARSLAEEAIRSGASWTQGLGRPPADPTRAEAWWERVSMVAAYRDRWHVRSDGALGPERQVRSVTQLAHRNRTARAAAEAARLAGGRPQAAQIPGATPEQSPEVRL